MDNDGIQFMLTIDTKDLIKNEVERFINIDNVMHELILEVHLLGKIL